MKTKFTSGEWTVGDFVDTTTNKEEGEKGHFPINAPSWSSFVICYRHVINETREQAEANARLIAAAPEMLKALRLINDRMIEILNNSATVITPTDCFAVLYGNNEVNNAIAKAISEPELTPEKIYGVEK